ncbi:MAG: LPS-assembly protein LptD [Flavobacteriaceae bacterium]|nr:LPS-assembly protein LptD [Flavobacteriaceae bacterium]
MNKSKDSLFTKNNSVKEMPINIAQDTIKKDTLNLPKELLETIIKDKAKDYKDNDFLNRKAILYNEAELYYQDIELKSGIITIDYAKNLAYARGIIDSLGNYTQRPFFKQGNQESEQDSLVYNFKSKKAVIYNIDTEQDGMLMNAQKMKRENDSTIYMNKAEITTSKKEKRDYYIRVNNIKVIPEKKAVGGLSQLFIADVPTPITFPFFYVPLTKGRASGLLLPTWGDNNRGYFFQNGGFYFAINDYVDLAVTGDIYTNGSWGLRFDSNYKNRYKFGGRFSLRFENLINGQRGLSNFSKTNNFNLTWSHNQDAKASPNSKFSASVNFGTSQFFRQSLNELNTPSFLNNTLNSSISYFKNFVNTPFSINAALTHSQNTNTNVINMSLPNLNVNMDRIYPFALKDGAKKNPIQNIGLTYSMSLQNDIQTNDADFLKAKMFDEARSGVQHNIAINTNIKALKYITLSPSASYKDIWYLKTINKNYDAQNNEIVTDTLNGFESFRTYSGGVSAATIIYGMFNFKKGKIKALKHTMKPSVSYNYTPDFGFYYEDVQNNVHGDTEQFSRFDGGVFGAPSRNLSQNLSFALRNLFEAKVKDRDSTKTEYKKLTLLNNLDFSANYNMVADSLKWSVMRMTASTKLFESLNLNFNATFDPYAINASGRRLNTFNIKNGGSLFRLTNAVLNASYNLSNETFSKKKNSKNSTNTSTNSTTDDESQFGDDSNFGKNQNNEEKEETKLVKLFNSTIPWKLNLNYNIGYSNLNREQEIAINTVRFTGTLELTPKWSINYSSGYDIKGKGLSYTRLGFARDLDSWRMNFSWTPFGDNAAYYFFIGVKASTLSDLKYDQRKVPDQRLF